MAKRIMECIQWYHWLGAASVIGTGLLGLYNRRTLDKIQIALDVIQNYKPDKGEKQAEILDLLSNELGTLTHHDQRLTAQELESDEVKQQVFEVEKKVQTVDEQIEKVSTKVDAVDKKASGVSGCKRRLTNIERNLSASLESCGLQISNVSQQLAALEAVYTEQIDTIHRDMVQFRTKLEMVDKRITDLERDRSFFSVLRGGDLAQVEQLLDQATLPPREPVDLPTTPRAESESPNSYAT